MSLNQRLANRMAEGIAELKERQMEALRLYRPMPHQLPFHQSAASERVVRGGNRSGKSTSAAVELASAVTRVPITDHEGNKVPFRYPTDRPLIVWIIGYDLGHIGRTIHRLLFKAGAFKIIRDKHTKQWRAYQPWNPEDSAREKEAKPAPPLIPPRYIDPKGWSWEKKSENIFTLCRLKNGTEIFAFSSKAEAPAGVPVDIIWIDEDIDNPDHVGELQARLTDNRGRLFWSSLPYMANEALVSMSERAAEQATREHPDVFEVVLRMSQNPFMPADEVRKRAEGWSEEERRARDGGEFIVSALMYPNFSRYFHGTPNLIEERDSPLDRVIRQNNGTPPADWCRYMIVDPGSSRPTGLFAAVPPPELGDYVVIYDELCVPRIDAYQFARLAKNKAGNFTFQLFGIDTRASRQTPMGFGKTIYEQYRDAFEDAGFASIETRFGFRPASDNVESGLGLVRDLLRTRPDGTPRLRIVTLGNPCPTTIKQFESYRKKIRNNVEQDLPADGQKSDAMDCVRYLASLNPNYVRPTSPTRKASAAYQEFLREREMEERRKENEPIHLGPATAA